MTAPLKNALRWLVIFIATLVICVVGSAPVFVTGLVAQEIITSPLTLIVMGLLAALTSSWMSNIIGGDYKHSRILRIVSVTEVASIILALFQGVFSTLNFGPNILKLALWGLGLSIVACIAARKLRSPTNKKKEDIFISLILLALAPIVVVVTIAIASFMGLTGA